MSGRAALSLAQERRLIAHLDQQLLELSRKFEVRRSPHAELASLEQYLQVLEVMLSFILTIPPFAPSGSLRIAYLLHLTSLLPDAVRAYALPDPADILWSTLFKFEQGWLVVLAGAEWDSKANQGKVNESPGEGLRQTDKVRLRSIIQDIKDAAREAVGGPGYVSMKVDPFQAVLVPRLETPSLVSDSNVSESSISELEDEGDESGEDDEEMEEVDILMSPINSDSVSISRHDIDGNASFDITLPAQHSSFAATAEHSTSVETLPIREAEWNDGSNGLQQSLDDDDDAEEDTLGEESREELQKIFAEVLQMLELG